MLRFGRSSLCGVPQASDLFDVGIALEKIINLTIITGSMQWITIKVAPSEHQACGPVSFISRCINLINHLYFLMYKLN